MDHLMMTLCRIEDSACHNQFQRNVGTMGDLQNGPVMIPTTIGKKLQRPELVSNSRERSGGIAKT